MRLLFIRILLHKPHEEDQQNRSSRDSYDDRSHHNSSTKQRIDRDVSISNCDLRDYLIVQTSDECVQFCVDLAE